MLASATEVEVELHVPENVSTFFGVTWAQDPRKDKIFIKAFPRGSDGRRGILESTGLVEVDDCLTAINGVPLDKSSGLHEVMACIRAAKSPLSLRFARYPPPPLLHSSSSSSSSSFFSGSSASATGSASVAAAVGGIGTATPSPPAADSLSSSSGGGRGGNGSGDSVRSGQSTGNSSSRGYGSLATTAARARARTGDAEDPELDAVLNSALVLGLGERVAEIQKRNGRLLQEVDRIGRAAASKRQGVEKVASAAASLTAAGDSLPKQALRLLSAARHDAVALCEAMARLDELLAVRERAQMARRRNLEQEDRRGGGGMASGGGGGDGLPRGVRR
ncbi:unnamed protein product [Pylaiella littoralis]